MDEQERMFQAQAALQSQNIEGQRSFEQMRQQNDQQTAQAAILQQTNPSAILYDIELKLRGKRLDIYNNIVDSGKPLMNDLGINRMLAFISSIVNQNTILSHLEDPEISKLIIRIGDDIIDDLTLNWTEYGIDDENMLDIILDMVVIPAFLSLKRAYRQNEKNWLNKTVVESITSAPKIPNKRESFLSRFKI